MKILIITLLASSLFFIHSARAQEGFETFQSAASAQLPLKVQEIVQALEFMNDKTKPVEVKEVRKALGDVKIELDLYCPLYSDKKYKEVLELREVIDEGYEVLGLFKDLYDTEESAGIQADVNDVISKRKAALKWRATFHKFLADSKVQDLLSRPLSKSRECLSPPKLLWARIKKVPKADDLFDEVLSELVTELIKGYEKDQKKLLKIDHLFKYSDEERFHDFRKGVRTVLKLIDFYPKLSELTKSESKLELEELVDQFGSINDLLVAYYKASGNKRKNLMERIESEWKDLQGELERVELGRLVLKN